MRVVCRHGRATAPILLVGNKWDLDRDGSVIESAQEFAAANGMHHLVVSAKTGERVMDAFVGMSRLLMAQRAAELPPASVRPVRAVPAGEDISIFSCCKTS